MAEIVIMGAGLGGAVMAYEMKKQMRPEDKLTVVTKDPIYHFVPSNPWVAVGWRTRESVEVDLAPAFAKRGIGFKPVPVSKVLPDENRLELEDGTSLRYDYLVVATGPELAFDEVEGLGPDGFSSSICHMDHALKAAVSFEEFCKNPKPIVTGAVQGASCSAPPTSSPSFSTPSCVAARSAAPSRVAADNVMLGTTTIRVRPNVMPWLRRSERIYLALPAQPPGPISLSWTTDGRFQPGQVASGNRVLVYAGPISAAFMEDTLTFQFKVAGTLMQRAVPVTYHFELDED